MSLALRTQLEDIAEELARTISHPAYLEKVREIHNAPSGEQYAMAQRLTVDWAARQGVPVSRRFRSVPRTFENPALARANGVQQPGAEPGAETYGAAPPESYDHASWRSEAGGDFVTAVPEPEQVARAVRAEMGAIIDFVVSEPFQFLLAELRFTPFDQRPRFVLDVVLDRAEREERGVFVPENMLIQRSTFHDGRPTLFCVSAMTKLAEPWRKLTYTFDNDLLDRS